MLETQAGGRGDDMNQLLRGEVIRLRGPAAIRIGATVETAFVALVSDRNAKVIYLSIKRIGECISHILKSALAQYSIRNLR